MKLIEWLALQSDVFQYNVIDVQIDDGNDIYIALSKIESPVPITPQPRGYHTHDNLGSHPVATKHTVTPAPIISTGTSAQAPSMYSNNPDYVMDCDAPKCNYGKYLKANGSFNICYRCDGKGWINQNKYDRNIEYDKRTS